MVTGNPQWVPHSFRDSVHHSLFDSHSVALWCGQSSGLRIWVAGKADEANHEFFPCRKDSDNIDELIESMDAA